MEANEFLEILKKKGRIDEMTTEIEGFRVSVYEETTRYSEDVSQSLTVDLVDSFGSFKRTGYKEISYERWVDTNWSAWKEIK